MLTPNAFVIHTIHRFFGMVTLFVVDAINTTEKIFHSELIFTFPGRGKAQEWQKNENQSRNLHFYSKTLFKI
jgi:hypothetical protein